MRIAILSAAKSVHTIKWVTALALRGHKVVLFSLPDHKAPKGAIPDFVKVYYLKTGGAAGYWLGAGELRRQLAKFKPDILNAHYATGYGTLARRCGYKPLLLSVWGSDVYEFPYISKFNMKIIRKNLYSSTAVASTSFSMAEQVKKLYNNTGKPEINKKIFITPFGVDTDMFKKIGETPGNGLTIGIIKAMEQKYGIDILLRAFALLKKRLHSEQLFLESGIRLELYGLGPQTESLKKLADELKITDNVRFFGAAAHSQVPHILSGFHIFCAPSRMESFGVAAVEAMACGVPVVVSDADGLKEVVKDGVTGFVVPREDFVMLSNKLYLLAVSPKLRAEMGEAGREHVLQFYDWEQNVGMMEQAMHETIELQKKQ